VSLEEAHGMAAEREGIGRVLYDFTAQTHLELSLCKVGALFMFSINVFVTKSIGKTIFRNIAPYKSVLWISSRFGFSSGKMPTCRHVGNKEKLLINRLILTQKLSFY